MAILNHPKFYMPFYFKRGREKEELDPVICQILGCVINPITFQFFPFYNLATSLFTEEGTRIDTGTRGT